MTDRGTLRSHRIGARLLALLVLVSIGWGTAAEATHRHGVPGVRSNLARSANVPQSSSPTIETDDTGNKQSRSGNANQCLICQLQQNLSASLFQSSARTSDVDIQVVNEPPQVTFELSEFAAHRHGRAPPINL